MLAFECLPHNRRPHRLVLARGCARSALPSLSPLLSPSTSSSASSLPHQVTLPPPLYQPVLLHLCLSYPSSIYPAHQQAPSRPPLLRWAIHAITLLRIVKNLILIAIVGSVAWWTPSASSSPSRPSSPSSTAFLFADAIIAGPSPLSASRPSCSFFLRLATLFLLVSASRYSWSFRLGLIALLNAPHHALLHSRSSA